MTTVALGEVALINPRAERPGPKEDVAFVGMADLSAESGVAGPGVLRPFHEVSKGYTVFRDEDLLVAKITPCFENGKMGQAKLRRPIGVGSTEFHVVRPNPGQLDSRFALHFLRQGWIRRAGELRMTGSAGQRRVPAAFLTELEVPLAPIEEQRRIAAILDHADQIRRRFIERLNALSSLETSVFRDRFAADGAATTVADVADKVRTGPFGSQLLHGEFVDEGVAVLGLDNVVGNQFRWAQRRYITHTKYEQLKRYTVHPGDVLISIMGTVGRCVVVPEGIPIAINTKHICAVTPDQAKVLPVFLRAAFLSHPRSRAFLRQQTKGAIMDGLNMGIINSMPLPLPSIRRQEEYVRGVAAIHRERDHAELELAGADQLVSSLQARAFSGRL